MIHGRHPNATYTNIAHDYSQRYGNKSRTIAFGE